MAVWFKRRLQCLHCEESALFDAEIAPGAGRPRTPANDCRNNVLRTQGRAHALNHGGTIARKEIQAGVRSAKAHHQGGMHEESIPT